MATKVYLIPGVGFVQVPDGGTREYHIPGGGFFSEGTESLTHYSLSCSSGSFSVSGTSVDFGVTFNLQASTGSVTVDGTDVSLEYGRLFVVTSGEINLLGTDVDFKYNKLSIASGTYVTSGSSLDFRITRKISCASGEVALSGTSVGFVLGKSIAVSSGSFTLLGSIIGTNTNRIVDAVSGEYDITGVDAGLIKGSHILIESDSFSVSGTDVDLRPGKGIVLTSGSITVTGKNVHLLYSVRDHVMSAESGTFIIHGKPVTLKFSGGNPSTLALRINTKLAALSQYSNFNFHSVCYYNGVLLGANNGGIFRVDQEDDLGVSINSFFEIFGADFNSNYRKFIRSSTISGVFDKIRVSVVADSTECTAHDSLYDATVEQKSVSIDMNKDDRGKYIGVKISNIDGSDFSIDGVSLVAGLVQKYSPSEAVVGRSKLNFSGTQITAGGS